MRVGPLRQESIRPSRRGLWSFARPIETERPKEPTHGKYRPVQEARPSGRARYAVNKARRSRIRTFLRKVEEAIASGDQDAAAAALKAAQPELARGVTKGVLHKNTVARKMSRLSVAREGRRRQAA